MPSTTDLTHVSSAGPVFSCNRSPSPLASASSLVPRSHPERAGRASAQHSRRKCRTASRQGRPDLSAAKVKEVVDGRSAANCMIRAMKQFRWEAANAPARASSARRRSCLCSCALGSEALPASSAEKPEKTVSQNERHKTRAQANCPAEHSRGDMLVGVSRRETGKNERNAEREPSRHGGRRLRCLTHRHSKQACKSGEDAPYVSFLPALSRTAGRALPLCPGQQRPL